MQDFKAIRKYTDRINDHITCLEVTMKGLIEQVVQGQHAIERLTKIIKEIDPDHELFEEHEE